MSFICGVSSTIDQAALSDDYEPLTIDDKLREGKENVVGLRDELIAAPADWTATLHGSASAAIFRLDVP